MPGSGWTECGFLAGSQAWEGLCALLADAGVSGRIPWPMVWALAWIAVPVFLAPVGVLLLRPLFAMFLRLGADLFTDVDARTSLCRAIGHYLAVFNVAIFIVTWSACWGCRFLEWPKLVGGGIGALGLLIALAVTIHLVRRFLDLRERLAVLVGLVAFGGGNLPLFVIVPTIMALT
jgi:hypothetical protein